MFMILFVFCVCGFRLETMEWTFQVLAEEKLPDTFAPSTDERDLRDARRVASPETRLELT